MKCLTDGGLTPKHVQQSGEMELNPYGVFELEATETNHPAFPSHTKYRGHLVKVSPFVGHQLEHSDYYTVFMTRRYGATLQSAKRTGQARVYSMDAQAYYLTVLEATRAFRKHSIAFATFDIMDIVDSPLATFQTLSKLGWPIDPELASKTVCKSHVHYQ